MELFFVDCEAVGLSPCNGHLTEIGIVHYPSRHEFHGIVTSVWDSERIVFDDLYRWVRTKTKTRAIMVSDNPAYDFQWINYGFDKYVGENPFGHSARRISDFYAGLVGDFTKTQEWKRLRVTEHDHNPVHDALGNLEAFERLLKGER
jgi:hypothetical protein